MDAIQSRLEEIAQDVRRELMTDTNAPPYLNQETLENGCHLGAYRTYKQIMEDTSLMADEQNTRILRLILAGNNPLEGSVHFVAAHNGYIIDPTFSQYPPNATKFVWGPGEKYPLRLKKPEEDVTEAMLQFSRN